MEDINHNKISFDYNIETYYVFLNDLVCKECVAQINGALQNKKKENKIRIISILKNSNNLLAKRQNLKTSKLLIDCDEYCFRDVNSKPNIFTKMIGDDYSPSVIIQKGNKLKILTYNDLFGNSEKNKNFVKKLNI